MTERGVIFGAFLFVAGFTVSEFVGWAYPTKKHLPVYNLVILNQDPCVEPTSISYRSKFSLQFK